MFVLPNGKKFEEWDLFDAMMSDDKNSSFFLDSETGEIGELKRRSSKKSAKEQRLKNSKRYIPVPRIDSEVKYKELQKYNDEFFGPEFPVLSKKLTEAITNRLDFAKCLKILEKGNKSEIAGWMQWAIDSGPCEEMDKWVESLAPALKIDIDMELDDDCELCKLFKQGEHTLGDFMEAAAKEKKKGALVGGPNFFQNLREPNKNDYYYDAMDCLPENVRGALDLLNKALEMDPDYIQTYVGFAEAYNVKGDKKSARQWIDKAYEKLKKTFPKWPKEMHWGELDNRPYLRTLAHKADYLLDDGKRDEAIELYRLILKLNPGDNQGIRYLLAGIYEGLSGDDINRMIDEGNEKQDWDKLEKLVARQNKIHKFWKVPRE